jgi:hypothetical protein
MSYADLFQSTKVDAVAYGRSADPLVVRSTHSIKERTMLSRFVCTVAVGALTALAGVGGAWAQSAEVLLQNSKTYAIGNKFYLYSLPTKTAGGKVSYWDVELTLDADASGKPATSTVTKSVPAPKIKKSEFVQGTYVTGTATCSLTPSAFDGRTQFELNCIDSNSGYHYIGVWHTGPIAGHPEEVRLRAAKLDLIPGSEEYSWGKTAYAGGTWFGCFDDTPSQELLSARQVGNVITLINWGVNDVEDCRVNLTKQD